MRLLFAIPLLLFCACGGSTNPTPGSTPASITIQAGNNQQASSGTAVATAPAVIVKDSDGDPVAGATVQFTVTAGAGTLTGASQQTDISGIARVTSWTLGGSGAQRLSAKVGTLEAVFFDAVITPGTETTTATIPTTGGTVAITTPGHPYQGFVLTIPSGSFPVAKEWSVRLAPNAPVPTMPAGLSIKGTPLIIETNAARSSKMMTMTVPAVPSAGKQIMLALYDPVRGAIEVLPSIARTATTVTVMTAHLNSSLLLGPNPTASLFAALPLPQSTLLQIEMATAPLLTVPSVATSEDLWPAADLPTEAFPQGHGIAIPVMNTVMHGSGSLLSNLIKVIKPASFHAEVASYGTLEIVANTLGSQMMAPLAAFNDEFVKLGKADRDQITASCLSAALALTGRPTPVGLYTSPTNLGTSAAYAVVVASAPTAISFIEASDGSSKKLDILVGVFEGVLVKMTKDVNSVLATHALPMPSFIVPYESVAPDVARMTSALTGTPEVKVQLSQTIAQLADFQVTILEHSPVPSGPWLPVSSELVVRKSSEKLRAVVSGTPFPFLLADPNTFFQGVSTDGSPIDVTLIPNYFNVASHVFNDLFGSALLSLNGQTLQKPWLPVRWVKEPFVVTPETAPITASNRLAEFSASVGRPPTEGFRVKWEWGDGTAPSDNLGTTTASHTYATASNFTVIATLTKNDAARTVLAVDTAQVEGESAPFWRLTAFADQDHLFEDEEVQGAEELQRLAALPAAGLIGVTTTGPNSELFLRIKKTGSWPNQCCPPVFTNDDKLTLGNLPSVQFGYGPFFTLWNTGFWSQSTTDLNAGTMGGLIADGATTYTIRGGGLQVGPDVVVGFSATRAGTTLSGVITIAVWEPAGDGMVDLSSERKFRFPFTAVRLK